MTRMAMALCEEAWTPVSFLIEQEQSCNEGQPHP